MQNHRPENNENMNGKTSLLFSTVSSLEKVLAIPGGCSRAAASTEQPSRGAQQPRQTPEQIPQALPFPKASVGDTKGHLEDTGTTVGRGSLTHPHTLFRDRP